MTESSDPTLETPTAFTSLNPLVGFCKAVISLADESAVESNLIALFRVIGSTVADCHLASEPSNLALSYSEARMQETIKSQRSWL